uniref:Uncharacterized protein n=1 Tax=Desulfobacca acetoxidans TaxID=60893 RepID=A0A7V4G8L0_9BACT
METAHADIGYGGGRDISKEQAQQEIRALFAAKKAEELLYVDDIMEALDLRYELVAEVCKELEQAGEIRGVRIEYDIHSKVAALLKTPDADLLKRLVDLLFEKYYDPEPLSPREKKALAESEAELQRGEVITLEELASKFGL